MAFGGALVAMKVLGLVPEREGDAHEIHHEPPTARDRRNIIMILGVTMTLTLIAVTAFVTALPKLVETLDLGTREGLTRVGLLTGAIYLAASGAQFVGGHYADRGAARRTYLGSFALLAAVFVAAALTDNWLRAAGGGGHVPVRDDRAHRDRLRGALCACGKAGALLRACATRFRSWVGLPVSGWCRASMTRHMASRTCRWRLQGWRS